MSKPKHRLVADLQEGIVSLDNNEHPAQYLWGWYKDDPDFEGVVFDQFEARLKDHRKQVAAQNGKVALAARAFANYRMHHPQNTHDSNGKPLWNGHPAQTLLKEAVENNEHVGITPQELYNNGPSAYREFDLAVFRNHIYQEIRLRKFKNYLQQKRQQNETENRKRWEKEKKDRAARKKMKQMEEQAAEAKKNKGPKSNVK